MVKDINEPVNIWLHITNSIVFISFLLMLFPLYKIIRHVWCRNDDIKKIEQYKINVSSPDKNQSILTKLLLLICILTCFLFLLIVSFYSLTNYISIFNNKHYCIYTLIIGWCLYIIAKYSLISYFIFRAYDSFRNSIYAFNSAIICLILPFGIPIISFITFCLAYIAIKDIDFHSNDTHISNGIKCEYIYKNDSFTHQILIYGIGGLIDVLFTIYSLSLFIYKFGVMIQEQISNNINNNNNDNPDNNDDRNRIDSSDVYNFYSQTKNENRWLLLITKLLVLLFINIISTITAFIIYYLTNMYYFGYSLDILICIYCLFFTFEYYDYYYYNFCFCSIGFKCSKFIFPFTKTCIMTFKCLNNDCCGQNSFCWCNKQCIYICIMCKCQCCFCCECCNYGEYNKKQRQIYIMAKSEVDLLISTVKHKDKPRQDNDLWN